jgi:DNA-binding NarL/FixJ family response regulator
MLIPVAPCSFCCGNPVIPPLAFPIMVTANTVLLEGISRSHHNSDHSEGLGGFWKNLHASQIVAPMKRLRCNGLRVWQGLCFEFTDVVVPAQLRGRWSVLRILIADDHEVARHGIRALLEAHAGWEVCAEAKDGREAVELASTTNPALILLDIGMPNLNGLEAARKILAASPDVPILILTMHDSDQVVREVLRVGARGFLLKSDAGRDLVAAVEALQMRRTFFTTKVSQMVLEGYLDRDSPENREAGNEIKQDEAAAVLTGREREVIQLLAEGKTSKEVAVALRLSVKTAETHRTNLMRKLDLHSVADLTRYAVRNGIVQVF